MESTFEIIDASGVQNKSGASAESRKANSKIELKKMIEDLNLDSRSKPNKGGTRAAFEQKKLQNIKSFIEDCIYSKRVFPAPRASEPGKSPSGSHSDDWTLSEFQSWSDHFPSEKIGKTLNKRSLEPPPKQSPRRSQKAPEKATAQKQSPKPTAPSKAEIKKRIQNLRGFLRRNPIIRKLCVNSNWQGDFSSAEQRQIEELKLRRGAGFLERRKAIVLGFNRDNDGINQRDLEKYVIVTQGLDSTDFYLLTLLNRQVLFYDN